MSDKTNITTRRTDDLISLFAQFGGLVLAFKVVGNLLIFEISNTIFQGLIANNLFSWSWSDIYKGDQKEEKDKNNKLFVYDDQYEIPIPAYLDWTTLFQKYFLGMCFCKRKWYADYAVQLNIMNKDLEQKLDLANLLKKIRGFSIAFTTILDMKLRRNISQKCYKISLDTIQRHNVNDDWEFS